MSEVFEHNPGDHEDPLTGPTWLLGLLGAVLLAVIGMGLTALLYNAQAQETVKKIEIRDPAELIALRAAQQARLHEAAHWQISTDLEGRQHKALVIPIDQAMEQVVKDYGSKK